MKLYETDYKLVVGQSILQKNLILKNTQAQINGLMVMAVKLRHEFDLIDPP